MINFTESDWRRIIYRGVESDELDYKAAQNWSALSREGKAKFVRHCLAMANTKGGYVVVGVGEDESGRPVNYTGLTEEESRSFDPSDVGSFVNRFADPPVEFTLERPVVDGKRYAVFVIRRFSAIPHVCGSNCGTEELRQGVFYIRTADASSRPAFRSSEMHALIQRALRNQREMLGRIIRGVLYENQDGGDERSRSHFREELLHSRSFFEKRIAAKPGDLLIEIFAGPVFYTEKRFAFSELKEAAAAAITWDPGALFLQDPELNRAYSTNVSCRLLDEKERAFLQMFRSGLIHRMMFFQLRSGKIDFRRILRFCTELVFFLASFYAELGLTEDLIRITVRLLPVENTPLSGVVPEKTFICRIPEINAVLERSASDLASDCVPHAAELIRSICARFNVPEGRLTGLETQIRKILEKRA